MTLHLPLGKLALAILASENATAMNNLTEPVTSKQLYSVAAILRNALTFAFPDPAPDVVESTRRPLRSFS